ncbi:hypothetical protein [Amycolatopsis sp. cg9]|uniref:effector-associated constant component EACC1 n=1 Tax=Amycolatopsis sp. cg9 TaxID=3238801 RepID=UPI00352673F8
MGDLADIVVITLGSSGAVSTLTALVSAWLRYRRKADDTITVSGPHGMVHISASTLSSADVDEVRAILNSVLPEPHELDSRSDRQDQSSAPPVVDSDMGTDKT